LTIAEAVSDYCAVHVYINQSINQLVFKVQKE